MPRRPRVRQPNLVIAPINPAQGSGNLRPAMSERDRTSRIIPKDCFCVPLGAPMTSTKRLLISVVVAALAIGGLWFWYFYFILCCAAPR
jgi:hypothetical protein